jgi:hypothetical protein
MVTTISGGARLLWVSCYLVATSITGVAAKVA